jgi:hypothetical protein
LDGKPKHLKEDEAEPYIEAILGALDSKQSRHFMAELLPQVEDQLIEDYRRKVSAQKGINVDYFKRNMERREEEVR